MCLDLADIGYSAKSSEEELAGITAVLIGVSYYRPISIRESMGDLMRRFNMH